MFTRKLMTSISLGLELKIPRVKTPKTEIFICLYLCRGDCDDKDLREVVAFAKLKHEGIVRYHGTWIEVCSHNEEPDTTVTVDVSDSPVTTSCSSASSQGGNQYLYIQMELCDSLTLRGWLDKYNTVETNTAKGFGFFGQVVDAVNYIHSKNLIHRDLKV